MAVTPDRRPLLIRFWARVDIRGPDECWAWLGGCLPNGYGYFKWRCQGYSVQHYAHRFAWEVSRAQPIPDGYEIDHTCHDPDRCALGDGCPHRSCANPDHLELVSPKTNSLRSGSPPARNAQKTHCPRGHPYDATNTYVNPTTGYRQCRKCRPRHRPAARRARRERMLNGGHS